MDTNTRLQRLRRHRNAAAVIAVLLLLTGFGLALPRSLARYRALRAAQAELVDLQLRVTDIQGQIVADQKTISALQQQIVALQGR